jgi:hypothetical protein
MANVIDIKLKAEKTHAYSSNNLLHAEKILDQTNVSLTSYSIFEVDPILR